MPNCPICQQKIPRAELEDHVNGCLDSQEGTFDASPPDHQLADGRHGGGRKRGSGRNPPQATTDEFIDVDNDGDAGTSSSGQLVNCPLCGVGYPPDAIQRHAAKCNGTPSCAPPPVRAEPTFNCPLCKKTEQPLAVCFRLDECGHPFCRRCMENYTQEQIYVAVSIKCPTCKAPFSIRDTEMLVPELYQKKKNDGGAKARRPPSVKLNPTRRLMEELRYLQESEKNGFTVAPVDDDLFHWNAFFFKFDSKTDPIAQDLKKVRGEKITLEIKFPRDYPVRPPSVRVLRPRLEYMTGHVTIGGSVCFEMLTTQGWEPQFTVESLLVSIRTNLVVGKARVDFSNTSDYTEREAKDAFDRMLRAHGWTHD